MSEFDCTPDRLDVLRWMSSCGGMICADGLGPSASGELIQRRHGGAFAFKFEDRTNLKGQRALEPGKFCVPIVLPGVGSGRWQRRKDGLTAGDCSEWILRMLHQHTLQLRD